jgi:hypothetical protein
VANALQLAKKYTKKELLGKNETKPLIPLLCLVIQINVMLYFVAV